MIAQAVTAALLAVGTLGLARGVSVVTGMFRADRQRRKAADADGEAVEPTAPDPIDTIARSRQRHEQLVANLQQTK